MAKPSAPYTSASRTASILSWVIVFPFLFLQWYRYGMLPLVNDNIDPSWTWVVASSFERGLRWGHDIVFTYGPLGFLHPQASIWPPLAETFRYAQIAITLLQALIATSLFALVDNSRRILMALVICVCAAGASADAMWVVIPAFSLLAIAYRSGASNAKIPTLFIVTVSAIYMGLIVGIKGNSIPAVGLWWVCTTVVLMLNRERAAALLCFLGTPAALIAFWLVAGQRLGDLLPHFANTFEIAAAYSGVMSTFPRWQIEAMGLAVIGAGALLVVRALWHHRREPVLLVVSMYVGLALFLSWKTGYTRADLHVLIFFFSAALLIPQLPRVDGGILRPAGIAAALAAVFSSVAFVHLFNVELRIPVSHILSLVPHIARENWNNLQDADVRRPIIEAASAEAKRTYALPAIRAEIGTATVDVVGYQQSVVALNDLNYAPRPVFQGYAAYTPRLARLNEAFLAGEHAPDYVMLPYSPIDGHPATLEDPLSYPTLLRRYVPVLIESNYLLLKRVAAPVEPIAVTAPESGARATIGEWIDVPQDGRPTMLSYAAELSLAGKAVAFLVREPMWYLEVTRDDGLTQKFRVTRSGGKTGFLLSPLVTSLDDWVHLFAREPVARVVRFRLLPQSDRLSPLVKPDYSYAFTPLDTSRWPSSAQIDARIFDSLYPGFNHRPARREGLISLIAEDGAAALFMHPPARLSFDLPAGSYVVEGEVGVRKAALSTPDCAPADGVAVSVQAAGAAPVRLARINPFADRSAPNPVRFHSDPITLAADGVLDYRVEFGDADSNPACDWAYVRGLKISPAPNPEAKP